jgi:hypothetical protein
VRDEVGDRNLAGVRQEGFAMTYPKRADQDVADQEVGRQLIDSATAARERGDGFLELRVRSGYAAPWLAAVEAVGWRLEHVGYVFSFTGLTSETGEVSRISGSETIGIYLLRSVN